ncbi:YihY/virulence factor BrkB family protein, partial [bacterium]|nr:YihY/virulence factor BrkB family protein [bacterium]
VTWRAAFGGAVLGAVLWEISRRLFGWYLSSIAIYSKLYGALGAFLAASIWIFYSANIFIIGAEYAAILNEHRKNIYERD